MSTTITTNTLQRFKDLNLGAKCYVVGAGPSLAYINISKIHQHVVISVNSSIMLMPWNENGDKNKRFWISNDSLCLQWSYFWDCVQKFNCTKLIRTSWKKHQHKFKYNDFVYFSPRISHEPINPNEDGLVGVSSVPSAIDLAILMGCKEIYLLGVDQKITQSKSHFWQFWDKKQWPKRNDRGKEFRHFNPEQKHQVVVFHQNKSAFESLFIYAKSKGVSIKNCNRNSDLKVFPFIDLAETT